MAPRGSEEAGVLYVLISYNVVESWLCWTHYYLSLIGTFEIEPSKPPDYGWVTSGTNLKITYALPSGTTSEVRPANRNMRKQHSLKLT